MEQILTLVCKLQPTPEQVAQIEATLQAFAAACNYANEVVKPQITSKTAIQSTVYQELRSQFGLSANLAVRACARVGANRKTAKLKDKPVKAFKPTSADYDARIFAFREKDWSVSLTLMDGRHHIKLSIGQYQIGKLKGKKPTSAQLCKHRDGNYYIHVQVKDAPPDPIKSERVIGIDFGRTDIAVTSEGQKWSGKDVTAVRDRYARTRASLQSKATKGTRSTRRRCRQILQRLSGKERRFQAHQNHVISKTIIQQALQLNAIVAIEDLTGIRERTNQLPRTKTERRRSNNWAFYMLRQFLEYKGIGAGVEVIAINPRYTSQTCHRCLHIHPVRGESYRSGKIFKCGHCGWHGDADLNGAKLIELVGSSVNRPEGNKLFCSLRAIESPRYIGTPISGG
ncbi:RNA-guided endonuclease InsQ/TnpB family protein [Aerosakkonema funiforme]|uniref:IS200/IS605 family element transposase accessory protein TnpB n=1 Tax=Aerosakkonema funiforme FACHB-1375 TaxID=2949571 RepID=A0A926VJZ7_9CYAN|nr:RNA-guided endonuclease TnpB family protein [Aerosakkonema funiforme]MBD2185276.1 IS200/IS605 family element transposase accessory protein TnpB [Aerosakkonema funiforme FACHB-1375]